MSMRNSLAVFLLLSPVCPLLAADAPPSQQVTRIPPYRPGHWVKVKDFSGGDLGSDLSGKIRRVKSVTCSINSAEQKRAVWRIHFEDGRCIEWHLIERLATEREVRTHGGAGR